MPAAASDAILVLNSGSSSLKFGVFVRGSSDEQLVLEGSAGAIGKKNGSLHIRDAKGNQLLHEEHALETRQGAFTKLMAVLKRQLAAPPIAVGHRVVHGGPRLREHQRLTAKAIAALEGATHFAPLHIPPALKLIRQTERTFPAVPQIACFDTAFHRTMPEVAAHLPLPGRYFEEGVMRYGFHGLSYESIVHRLGRELPARAVFAHLGNGSSVVAVLNGKSVDTSMGLTPTGGLVMSTRTGDLDPGVLIYLMRKEKFGADELEEFVNHECGLAGFSDGESDMQKLLARAAKNDSAAELAIAAFCVTVRKYVGAYAALMGGLDLLVFTGGIGEHSEEIRRQICDGVDFLNVSAPGGVRVMPSQEEVQIARHCRRLLAQE